MWDRQCRPLSLERSVGVYYAVDVYLECIVSSVGIFVRAVVGTLCFQAGYSVWSQFTCIVSDISVYLLRHFRNGRGDTVATIPARMSVHVWSVV